MKNKLFLTMLCAIWLCLIVACGMDFDTTTTPTAENRDTGVAEDMDLVVATREQEFFRNQNRSFSIMDEAMRPFRMEPDRASEGGELYNDSFAGRFIDDFGNLTICYVQNSITRQTEDTMNSLRGQVIYRQDAFSYNFLAQILEAVSEVMEDFGIYMAELDEYENRVFIYLTDINRVREINNFLSEQGAFDENAIAFIDDPDYIPFDDSADTAYPGEGIFRPTGGGKVSCGTMGVNAIDNATGRIGVITNEHVAGKNTTVWTGTISGNTVTLGNTLGQVSKAKNGGTVDASFTPFDNPEDWDMTPHARNTQGDNPSGKTHTNIRLGKESHIVYGAKMMKIGMTSGTTTGTIKSTCFLIITKKSDGTLGPMKAKTFRYKTTTNKGDSGGLVYYNDGSTLWLIGIHFSGDDSKERGTACRIRNVMSELNVTPITNDTFSVSVEGSMTSGPSYSFFSGVKITNNEHPIGRLTIPSIIHSNTISKIDSIALQNRTGISAVTIPSTVEQIGINAFYNTGIWNYTKENNVVYADRWAVGYKGIIDDSDGALGLRSGSVSGTVGIGDFAFVGVSGLKTVDIPDSVINIGHSAFSNNTALERIWIPKNVTSIDSRAFKGCPSLAIFVQAASQPAGWQENWNIDNIPVYWNFPAPPIRITISPIPGITVPAIGETPVWTISTDQYTGTVTWNPSHYRFQPGTQYTATINLSAKNNYTFHGIKNNSFTVTDASVTNKANSGVVTAVFRATASVNSLFSGGNGTDYAPYQIENVEQLKYIGLLETDGIYFELITDIDLEFEPWLPINFNGGFFNGAYNTISNLYVDAAPFGYYGLFGYNDGTISNLTVTAFINPAQHATYIGVIAGANAGHIDNCVTENANGYEFMIKFNDTTAVGGITGHNMGLLENCTNNGNIFDTLFDSSNSIIGGIAGHNFGGTVLNNANNGGIFITNRYSNNSAFAGIIGWQKWGTVQENVTSGMILDYYDNIIVYSQKPKGNHVFGQIMYGSLDGNYCECEGCR